MQRRTLNTMGVPPPTLPPWIHSTTSRTSLAGLEIGLPPSPASSSRDMSLEGAPSRLDKALPPLPRPAQENTTRRPFPKQFLSIPDTDAPLIPRKNPRRFSWVLSDVSPAAGSPLRPFRRTSSSIHSPISTASTSPSAAPAAALPPSDWQKNSSTSQPLKLKQPIPLSCQTNKVAQLTGCDLSSDLSPSHQRPRFESEASISSSLYSESDVSRTTFTSRERKQSDDSLSSIVDSYSDWGSWAPSKEDYSSPLSSPLLPPTPKISMDSVAAEDMGSTRTITSQSNTRAPVVPPLSPPRNRTRQLETPADVMTWTASYLKSPKQPPTLEHLIEQERTHLENNLVGELPLSPLAQLAALQLRPESGLGSSGDEKVERSTVRPQASMPTMPSYYQYHHVRSVSRFSDGSSEENDAHSVRSVASVCLRNGARGVRDSFARGLSGLNRPTSRTDGSRSRLSHLSDRDTTKSSQRTSGTSATTLSPAEAQKGHQHTLSSSTSHSIALALEYPSLISSKDPQKPKTRDSGFTRSWTAATQALKKPLRSSYFTHRPESGLERRKSKRHNRMSSAPAKFYGEGIRQERPRDTVPPVKTSTPLGAIDFGEARRQNVAMLPEEIVAASKLAVESTNNEAEEETLANQAVANVRRFSITGKAGKVLGSKVTTDLPPPLPISHSKNPGLPLSHVQAREGQSEADSGKRMDESIKKGGLGRGFSVMAMVGKELASFKAKAGIKSREEKRREQLKGLIRVVDVDEKEKGRPKKPMVPQRIEKKDVEQVKVQDLNRKSEVNPGLKDEDLSSAAQMWL